MRAASGFVGARVRVGGMRGVLAGVVAVALAVSAVAPAQAFPIPVVDYAGIAAQAVKERTAAAGVVTLAKVRAAAAANIRTTTADPAGTDPTGTGPAGTDPATLGSPGSSGTGGVGGDVVVGSGRVTAGSGDMVSADAVGASIVFGGEKTAGVLAVDVAQLPATVSAAAAIAVDGVAVSAPVEVTATDSAGVGVTRFEAAVTTVKVPDGPVIVTSVDPGVTVTFDVDKTQLAAAGVDPATARIFTRENTGDPWIALASRFDAGSGAAGSGRVVGESAHLSQFVVIGFPFVAPVGPSIVLDPDDGVANTTSPGVVASELPYNIALSKAVQVLLEQQCLATVTLTRDDPNTRVVSEAMRAATAAAANPALTATIAFDAPEGHAWGTNPSQGGTKVFNFNRPADDALAGNIIAGLPTYTGRPAQKWNALPNGVPHAAFANIAGAYTHLEVLNLDNNYDWAVINDPAGFQSIANSLFASFAQYLTGRGLIAALPPPLVGPRRRRMRRKPGGGSWVCITIKRMGPSRWRSPPGT
ncbi:hypothetical protein EH165_06515 [Nakamurella antarctica]|uniref:MurNAc-LAA domain-containing protein n=1 Tax=Nakamurella antarctica TaxID=1902245 RepID=A0A3G8ZLZ9_9ACTN|nr:N-acetylmuramoyl-L-alanine amidase [Nakamurella antarctica]AZI57855.1 hypothetical protein EH165_06515 [Nakamurella antarctica]